MNVIVFTRATMPEALQKAWLQHMRDFDSTHPGCHFEIGIDGPEATFADMIRRLQIEPGLTFTKIFERAKWRRPTDDDFA